MGLSSGGEEVQEQEPGVLGPVDRMEVGIGSGCRRSARIAKSACLLRARSVDGSAPPPPHWGCVVAAWSQSSCNLACVCFSILPLGHNTHIYH